MMKKSLMVCLAAGIALAQPNAPMMAGPGGKGLKTETVQKMKQQAGKPFLITGILPHSTMLLKQNWDNPQLNLSEDQKVKLLKVREQTVSNVQRLKKAIAPLEVRVAERILAGATPNELNPLVQKIASLKAEATMTHLRCIHDTQLILSKEQLDFLMKR